MTDKHTPGPWLRIDGPDYAEIHAAFRPSSPAVALVGKAEDADLIASAPDMATRITALEAREAELVKGMRYILPYIEWTIGRESPGHHPTMPSAVAEFRATLAKHQEGE